MRRKLHAWLALLCLVACYGVSYWLEPMHFHDIAWQKERDLTCDRNAGVFTIAQFTDLHFGETDEHDARSKANMASILAREPAVDLIVFGGDQVSGWMVWDNARALEKHAEALSVAAERRLPFATIFGNHDDQPYAGDPSGMFPWMCALAATACLALACSLLKANRQARLPAGLLLVTTGWICWVVYPSTRAKRSLLHSEKARYDKLSRTQQGDSSLYGQSNYFLPVACKNRRALLFFLDSGGGWLAQGLTSRQLEWVSEVARRNPGCPSVLFVHIPTHEFGETVQAKSTQFKCWGQTQREPSSDTGDEPEGVMASLFSAGVKAVFVGHDHGNSWCCVPRTKLSRQPALCYGRHTGDGGYGRLERGARLIRLSFSENFVAMDTWLRLGSGHRAEEGVLAINL